MSMLGCVCQDVPTEGSTAKQTTRMSIQCSVARYQSEQAEEAMNSKGLHVPVTFALATTADYLQCKNVKIVVDSVRWPLTRLSRPGSLATGGRSWTNPLNDLASNDGTDHPGVADAAIWVIPACKATGTFSPVCERTFAKAACFPYCLAVRTTRSASQGLVLYNADDWARNIQLMNRDCRSSYVTSDGLGAQVSYVDSSDLPKTYNVVVQDKMDPFGKATVVAADGESGQSTFDPVSMMCVASDTISSRVNVTHVASIHNRYESILMDEQPFAVAGGCALNAVYKDDGSMAVRVQRLFGDEGTDSFTLVTIHAELPAIPRCTMLSACDEVPRNDRVSIPYPWYSAPARHNPAVETRWGLFYAVNPSLDMFSEYVKYCKQKASQLQVQAVSTYGGIRIWRVDAFAFTSPEAGDTTTATGASVELPDSFGKSTDDAQSCGNMFNVIVTSMEYLNPDNIAVQVIPKHFFPCSCLHSHHLLLIPSLVLACTHTICS
jgi:hypothetical protein